MMPALLPLLGLLRNPWVLVLIVSALGMGGTGWYRMKWLGEVNGRERAVAEAQIKADRLANELIVAQAAAMAVTERKVVTYVDRIRTVQAPDTACPADPRMRLGNVGVRDIIRGGEADPPGRAPAAVPGPGAGARP